jgi:hypothetical protein
LIMVRAKVVGDRATASPRSGSALCLSYTGYVVSAHELVRPFLHYLHGGETPNAFERKPHGSFRNFG